MYKNFGFSRVILGNILLFSAFFLWRPPQVQAAGEYCAPQRVINQWGCKEESMDLCDTFWWQECPPADGTCYGFGNGSCIVDVTWKCEVIEDTPACRSAPVCETIDEIPECLEGINWKSSCRLYNKEHRGCWVYAYSCDSGTGSCDRDETGGTYYGNAGLANCNNECSVVAPTPVPTSPPGSTPVPTLPPPISGTPTPSPTGSLTPTPTDTPGTDWIRFNGEVFARDLGFFKKWDGADGLGLSCSGNCSNAFWTNGHFDASGKLNTNVQMSITNIPAGYTGCTWEAYTRTDDLTALELKVAEGEGCTASFFLNDNLDWRFYVRFWLEPQPATVEGRVYCSVDNRGIPEVPVVVIDTGGTEVARWYTQWPPGAGGRIWATFVPNLGPEFAVRIAGDSVYNGGYTATGSENICTGSGPLTQHENCPFTSVAGSIVGGFDFVTDTTASNLNVICDGDSATFTWNEDPTADLYILRADHEEGPWVGPKDYWKYVPLTPSGNPTLGSCNGTSCSVTLDDTTPSIGGFPFQPGRYWSWSIQAVYDGVRHCTADGGGFTCETCGVNISDLSLQWNETKPLPAQDTSIGTVNNVAFSGCSDPPISYSPTSDSSSPYGTNITGEGVGQCTLTATMNMSGGTSCSDTATITVEPPPCTLILTPDFTNTAPLFNAIPQGQRRTITASLTRLDAGTPDYVEFECDDTNIADIVPGYETDDTIAFSSLVEAQSASGGTTNCRASFYIEEHGSPICEASNVVEVLSDFCSFTVSTDPLLHSTLSNEPIPSESTSVEKLSSELIFVFNVVTAGGAIEKFRYTSSDDNIVTLRDSDNNPVANPYDDLLAPYFFNIFGNGIGGANVTVEGYMSGAPVCHARIDVTVLNPGAWWQAQGGDAVAGGGNIVSDIAGCSLPPADCPHQLLDTGLQAGPGSAITFGTIFFNSPVGVIGGWPVEDANLDIDTSKANYAFFEDEIPAGVTKETNTTLNEDELENTEGTPDAGGSGYRVHWYQPSSGTLTLSDTDAAFTLGTNKIVLYVDGNLVIDDDMRLQDGRGFFMAIVSGNITINPSVGDGLVTNLNPDLEGVYFAQGSFITAAGNRQFHARGAVAANAGYSLGRELGDNTTGPAEIFENGFDQTMRIPNFARTRPRWWREVAP